jgi:hypothetical protein
VHPQICSAPGLTYNTSLFLGVRQPEHFRNALGQLSKPLLALAQSLLSPPVLAPDSGFAQFPFNADAQPQSGGRLSKLASPPGKRRN